jgi:hypothetical protein
MLDEKAARDVIMKNLPDGEIQYVVSYQNLFIFQVFSGDPEEREFDPFFTVNKDTGEFRDFSLITDGNPEIFRLLEQANSK